MRKVRQQTHHISTGRPIHALAETDNTSTLSNANRSCQRCLESSRLHVYTKIPCCLVAKSKVSMLLCNWQCVRVQEWREWRQQALAVEKEMHCTQLNRKDDVCATFFLANQRRENGEFVIEVDACQLDQVVTSRHLTQFRWSNLPSRHGTVRANAAASTRSGMTATRLPNRS